jgi:hypothetical protein
VSGRRAERQGKISVPVTSYRDQLDRAKRFRERMRAASTATDFQDYTCAFFQCCWHVKDWVLNDPDVPEEKADSIVASAEASPLLRICHDLCSGTKHLRLDRPQSGSGAAHDHVAFIMHLMPMGQPDKPTEIDLKILDGIGNNLKSAHLLADECLAEWERVLQANGVQTVHGGGDLRGDSSELRT